MTALFVTNGHGEVAIARRIAQDARVLGVASDHLALVGAGFGDADFRDVGPQRAMPSGGLVAMFDVRAFARDLAAGWLPLFFAQRRFLREAGRRYDVVVAVGDAFGCAMALRAGRPTLFVGTAKSVRVAAYGPGERRILRRARRIFVRDEPTAVALRARGVAAEAPGNVMVDMLDHTDHVPWSGAYRIAIVPGSRPRAYTDALRLAEIVRAVAARLPGVDAALSIAPGLDPAAFAPALALGDIRPWRGSIGGLFDGATVAFGQAGTANEQAAASGIPVVALELDDARRSGWYRMRQVRLLGDGMLVVPGAIEPAAAALTDVLRDAPRRERMGRAGRERMGPPGGASAIAQAIAAHALAAS